MRIDIMTLFPDAIRAMMDESIIGRAQAAGYVSIVTHQIRDYTTNKQMQVDDYPYGGGRGAVMQCDPLYRCWDHICTQAGERIHTIYMSPCGRVFDQQAAKELVAQYDRLILVCGHYEGVDQRFIDTCIDEELSIGDFVLTGGELAAMVISDAVCRMVPGVLAERASFEDESHFSGVLEYPQYTRPEVWRDQPVPAVLLSGHHENIDKWRRLQALYRTRERRPDLFEKLTLTKQEQKLLRLLDEALEEENETV